MEAETLQLILSAVSGPASGIVVAILSMVGFGWFMTKQIFPRQDKFIDEFVKESRANRKVFVDAVEIMGRRLDKVEYELEGIGEDIATIKSKI
jgi:hypothetical protein